MAEDFVIEKYVVKMLVRGVGILLLVAAFAYPLDWAVWRVRVARGGGMDSVQVDMFTVGEMKGGKEDYYLNGTSMVPCSKSLYPQGGNGVCWWVKRHPEVIQRY
jgi:hypothetical protein